MIVSSKKGIELTLQTVAVFIICIVVLIVIIFFFTGTVTESSSSLFEISDSVAAGS